MILSCQTQAMTTARARARVEMIDQIKQAARRHLADEGPNLSLRAVARDLGVVSSAVYRYFGSRDELLTALIVDAYEALGAAAEEAEAAAPRRNLRGRWMAFGRGIRGWALANEPEYALLYGSPVPGYAAPEQTVQPASRPLLVLAAIVRDGVQRGTLGAAKGERLPRAVRTDLVAISAVPDYAGIPPAVLARTMTAWTQLFGTLSFELFGRLRNGITDYPAYFDYQLAAMADYLGLH